MTTRSLGFSAHRILRAYCKPGDTSLCRAKEMQVLFFFSLKSGDLCVKKLDPIFSCESPRRAASSVVGRVCTVELQSEPLAVLAPALGELLCCSSYVGFGEADWKPREFRWLCPLGANDAEFLKMSIVPLWLFRRAEFCRDLQVYRRAEEGRKPQWIVSILVPILVSML